MAEVGGAWEGLHKGEALFSAHGSRVLKSTESALQMGVQEGVWPNTLQSGRSQSTSPQGSQDR